MPRSYQVRPAILGRWRATQRDAGQATRPTPSIRVSPPPARDHTEHLGHQPPDTPTMTVTAQYPAGDTVGLRGERGLPPSLGGCAVRPAPRRAGGDRVAPVGILDPVRLGRFEEVAQDLGQAL